MGAVLLAILGWGVTAGCLSMGAPFWFNLLVQLVNVRRTGVKPDDNKKEKIDLNPAKMTYDTLPLL